VRISLMAPVSILYSAVIFKRFHISPRLFSASPATFSFLIFKSLTHEVYKIVRRVMVVRGVNTAVVLC
jgi:hypothetical protein